MTLTILTIVVHARLTILRAINGMTFPKLDLSQLAQLVNLPSHESIVIWISFGSQERSPPIDTRAK